MEILEYPKCRSFCKDADEFISWVRGRVADLDSLIEDHQFLRTQEPEHKILIAVDFYDILQIAFPLADPIRDHGKNIFQNNIRDRILRELTGRLSLFFGLQNKSSRSYYPLLMPYMYQEEYVATLSWYGTGLVSNESIVRLKQLEKEVRVKYKKSLAHLLQDLKVGQAPDGFLEFIIEKSPELFLSMSGAQTQGIQLAQKLSQKNIVTTNLKKWGFPDSLLDQIESDGEHSAYDEKTEAIWIDLFREEANRMGSIFKYSWITDIRAIMFIDHLNWILRRSDTRVLYVSSAYMVDKVLRANQNLVSFYSPQGKPIAGTSFFRGLDVFRFHNRFSKGSRSGVKPEQIIKEASVDRDAMLEVLEIDNERQISQFQSNRNYGTCIKDSEYHTACIGRSQLTPDLIRMIDNINKIRKKLFETHLLQSSDLFEEYLTEDKDYIAQPISDKTKLNSDKGISLLQELCSISEQHNQSLHKIVSKLKSLISAEFRLWLAISKLRTLEPTSDEVKMLFSTLTLFPFRVWFDNKELLLRITNLRGLMMKQDGEPDDKRLKEFYSVLMSIAIGCTTVEDKNRFWDSKISLTTLDKDSLERRLATVVLLFSLGMVREAYQSSEQLLSLNGIDSFRNEFMIISVQARIREYLETRSSIRPTAHREIIIRNIVKSCENQSACKDPRLLYLAGYAAGHLARQNAGLRNIAISKCKDSLSAIETINNRESLPDWKQTELKLLKASVLSSLAYYLALESRYTTDVENVKEAIRIMANDVPELIADENLTAIRLHNRGFVYHVAAELSWTKDEFQSYYDIAINSYESAKQRLYNPSLANQTLDERIKNYDTRLSSHVSIIRRDLKELAVAHQHSRASFSNQMVRLEESWSNLDERAKKAIIRLRREFVRSESRLDKDIGDLQKLKNRRTIYSTKD